MAKKPGPPTLSIVGAPGAIGPQPSRSLGEFGQALWDSVQARFDVSDPAGIAMLTQACVMIDRAEELASVVEDEGALIRTARSVKTNPCIKDEIACRNSAIRGARKTGREL